MAALTSRERVIRTIERKEVDRAPYSFDLTGKIAHMLSTHYRIAPESLYSFLGDDLLYVGMKSPGEVKSTGSQYEDEFGVLWDVSDQSHDIGDWGSILFSPMGDPSCEGFAFPDGSKQGRFDDLDLTELKRQERFVILGLTGLFDLCWHLRGLEGFMMDMVAEEEFAARLLDKMLEFNLGVIEQIPDAIDGVRFGEDWGLQKGLITGAPLWRKLIKPRLRVMYAAARAKGLKVFIHSCGDIQELFEDLIEIGVDVVHPIQPEAMDIAMLREKYGSRITMYGGLGTQSVLVFGTPADVIAQARERLAQFADGGYIFGPAGAISTDTKLENVTALVDFARNHYRVLV